MKRHQNYSQKNKNNELPNPHESKNRTVILAGFGNPDLPAVPRDLRLIKETITHAGFSIVQPDFITWQTEDAAKKELATIPKVDPSKVSFSVVAGLSSGSAKSIVQAYHILPKPILVWVVPARFALASAATAVGVLKDRGEGEFFLVARKPGDKRAILQFVDWLSSHDKAETTATRPYKISTETAAQQRLEMHSHSGPTVGKSKLLSGKRIGLIGNVAPGMIASVFDAESLSDRFGFELMKIETSELDETLKSIEGYEDRDNEVDEIWKTAIAKEASLKTVEKAARFDRAIQSLQKEHNLDAVALECWTKLVPKYGINPCFGHFRNLIVGCEGDLVMTVASMLMQQLSGTAPFLGDIVSIDYEKNEVSISHCSAPVERSTVSPDLIHRLPYSSPALKSKTAFAGVKFAQRKDVTILRLFGKDGGKAHVTTGKIVSSDHREGPIVVRVKLGEAVEKFANLLCGNHYLISYGNNEESLKRLLQNHGVTVS